MKIIRMALVFMLFLLGCASLEEGTYVVREISAPAIDIKKSISVVIGGVRKVSESGREIHSNYFSRFGEEDFNAETAQERLYSKVEIVGDRRPYDIYVTVFVQRKRDGSYVESGRDLGLARDVGEKIRARLAESRENRNVIDDFRVF